MLVLSRAAPIMASPYRLMNLAGLALGKTILPAWSHDHPSSASQTLPPGTYNVRQIVSGLSPLLDSVISRLGDDTSEPPTSRSVLVAGLAASLSTSGRESTLPLITENASKNELAQQAARVSSTILRLVEESIGLSPGADVRVRSPCEGHLWTPAVASLLLGPRSNSDLMQLYNEWLHSLILLRDALLPFENHEEVPLILSEKGLRAAEESRKLFLVSCITGNIKHSALVDMAKVLTAPALPQGGYAFQYAQGIVVPAFLSGQAAAANLLRYHSALVHEPEQEILFDYEHRDYFSALRTDISSAQAVEVPDGHAVPELPTLVANSSLVVEETGENLRRVVKLHLTFGCGNFVAVDLGQIARGHRYAYEPRRREDPAAAEGVAAPKTVAYNAGEVLSKPGLVVSPRAQGVHQAIHVIPAGDPILRLALLGKLYPENVILAENEEDLHGAYNAGKGFVERFVILGGSGEQTE